VHLSPYYPPHKGGVEQVAAESSAELAKQGCRVQVICSDIGAKESPHHELNGLHEVRRLRSLEFAHTPLMFGLFRQLLKIPRRSILHVHIAQAFVPEIAYVAARLRQARYVAHYHLDVGASGRLGFLLAPYQKLLLGYVLRHADKIIVPTTDYATVVKGLYNIPEATIVVVPNATADSVSRKFHNMPRSPLRLISIGRLTVQKNYPLLIEAMRHFRQTYPGRPFVLDIFGTGELKDELQRHIKSAGLADCVQIKPGDVSRKVLQRNLARNDVFILSTSKESFGVVYVEAMAKGLPIVTTDVPGVRNVVQDNRNGLLCAETPEALAEGLYRLLTERGLYAAMSAHNIEDAAQYTWPVVVNQLMQTYKAVARQPRRRGIGRASIIGGAVLWWVSFLALRTSDSIPDVATTAVGFGFLTLVPGMLTMMILRLRRVAAWGKLGLSVAFSLLEIMAAALISNTLLPRQGIDRPLDAPILIWTLSILLAVLSLAAWVRVGSKWHLQLAAKAREFFPASLDLALAFGPLAFVYLSVLGATSLNNGGTNLWTIVMLCGIAVYSLILVSYSRKVGPNTLPTALFFMALALLLMTSLRGWHTTGHDVQREYRVFQMAQYNGIWQIQRFRDAYNACLSITILPTVFANLLKLSGPYVYKVLFQIIFALCPSIVFLIARRWTSAAIALVATIYFLAFPAFSNDMPMLIRQEVAFLFLSLMLYVIFQPSLSLRARKMLFLILGIGLVLSHYSTTYSVIAMMLAATGIRLVAFPVVWLLRGGRLKTTALARFATKMTRQKSVLSIPVILLLVAAAFVWTTVLTGTGENTGKVLSMTVRAVQDGFKSDSRSSDTDVSIFSFKKADPQEKLQQYADKVVNPVRQSEPDTYYPNVPDVPPVSSDSTLPLTNVGKTLAGHGLDVATFNYAFRQVSARLLQILILIGLLYVFWRRSSFVRSLDGELFALSIGSALFVLSQVVLPVLSVEYGLMRSFQQSLMLLGIFIVLGSIVLANALPTRVIKLGLPLVLVITFFLSSTGVFTQILGGYYAQLNLNNAGTYYDSYYVNQAELSGLEWLQRQANDYQSEVHADRYGFMKPGTVLETNTLNDIYPGLIRRDAYVYLGQTTVIRGQATVLQDGDLITYSYPVQFLDTNKDLLYSNGDARVYR
jgi:uncharacterized membrane protein/glycosyltransferase involved in cell wall biosynthesis